MKNVIFNIFLFIFVFDVSFPNMILIYWIMTPWIKWLDKLFSCIKIFVKNHKIRCGLSYKPHFIVPHFFKVFSFILWFFTVCTKTILKMILFLLHQNNLLFDVDIRCIICSHRKPHAHIIWAFMPIPFHAKTIALMDKHVLVRILYTFKHTWMTQICLYFFRSSILGLMCNRSTIETSWFSPRKKVFPEVIFFVSRYNFFASLKLFLKTLNSNSHSNWSSDYSMSYSQIWSNQDIGRHSV